MRKEWRLWAVFLLQVMNGGVNAQLPFSSFNPVAGLNANSRHHSDAFSFTKNPAALQEVHTAGAVMGERKYGMKEGGSFLSAMSAPLGPGGLGLALRWTGVAGYRETEATLAYGRKLAGVLGAGAEIHFVSIGMDGYGKVSVPGFGLGLLFRLSQTVSTSVAVRDPVGRGFGKDGVETLPSVFLFGIGFEPSEQFLVVADLVKEERRGVEGRLSFQYLPDHRFRLRSSVGMRDRSFTLGAGWRKVSDRATTSIDIQSGWHLQLGFSSALQLQLDFPKK